MGSPIGEWRAAPWFFVAFASAILLAGCSGSTEESGGSGSSVSSAPELPPASNPTPPSDPTAPTPGTATDTVVALAWQPNMDPIAGYIVYYGPTPDAATTLAVQLSLANDPFNGLAPNVSFNAGRDLGLSYGDSVCFRLRAYNTANMLSGWSPAACGTI